MTVADLDGAGGGVGAPRWVGASLDVKEGRDPLGLQTTTQDRLMPRLLPGILELSRRARYFSFHAYMLDRYRELRLPADGNSLSTFIKAREWEYGLAVPEPQVPAHREDDDLRWEPKALEPRPRQRADRTTTATHHPPPSPPTATTRQ